MILSFPTRRSSDLGGPDVATLEDMRAEILLGETLQLLAEHDELDDPAVARLREHDATHRTSLCPSLLAYLQAFGDVRQAAEIGRASCRGRETGTVVAGGVRKRGGERQSAQE